MAIDTLRLYADPAELARGTEGSRTAIATAAAILQRGGTVAFATETVYGLGANALDTAALEKIFAAKRRPTWDPLIVHVADAAMLASVAATVPKPAGLWMDRFWPGPLTLLLPRRPEVPDLVTAGRPLVGVRMPRHPVAQALLRAAGIPIAAPSANLFGHVSPTTAAHVLADLDGRIDAVLDGGPSEHGLESTVVDASTSPCLVYRPGAITLEALRAVWPDVEPYQAAPAGNALESTEPASLPSPGVGIRHYAPRARLVLVEPGESQAAELRRLLQAEKDTPTGLLLPSGLLAPEEEAALPAKVEVFRWGSREDAAEMARHVFAGLRALDSTGVVRIVCPLPEAIGIGTALQDRLRKAAKPR